MAVDVAFYGLASAGVSLQPAAGRWPQHEADDRQEVGVGLAALPASKLPGSLWDAYRDALRAFAMRVADADEGTLPGDLVSLDGFGRRAVLSVVPWDGPGMTMVSADVVHSSAGPVPRLRSRDKGTGPSGAIAALALAIALAADADRRGRLALALGIEGLLAWYRESHRASPPRLALAYALEHARGRLGADDTAP